MKAIHASLILILLLAAACSSCSGPSGPDAPPRLDAFEPAAGIRGSIVTLHGAGFGADARHAIVMIGSQQAEIVSICDTLIAARVSPYAETGWVSVMTDGGSSRLLSQFTVTFSAAAINLIQMNVSGLPGKALVRYNSGGISGETIDTADTTYQIIDEVRRNGAVVALAGDTARFGWAYNYGGGIDTRTFELVVDSAARRIAHFRYTRYSQTITSMDDWRGSTIIADTIQLHDIPYMVQGQEAIARIVLGNIPTYLSRFNSRLFEESKDFANRTGWEYEIRLLSIEPESLDASITITMR